MNVPTAEPVSTNSKIPTAVANTVDNVTNTASSVASSVSENVNNASDYVKDSISSFGDSDLVGSSTSFLQSNTLIAKFAFLILVLIGFMILLNLGVKIIGYFTQPSGDPKLVNGTMNAANEVVIPQDPKNSQSIPILRSNNQNKGMEFSWSLWMYINDTSKSPKFSHVFNKGNATYDTNGIATVNNGPGLYIENENNNLIVVMNTVDVNNPVEVLVVKDIPLRKWFHCVIRIENTDLDVYINGTIVARSQMQDVPKQNYENVNICKNGGFNGNIADLQYFDKAISIFQINNIVAWGRNTSSANENASGDATGFPYYLSNLWYSSNY
tara:strand:+ start:236 stop:1213 length:978 start_codon:yes stop_codon:yes gene_type:complete